MLKTALIACALLAAAPAWAATPSPAEIERAERAFAADGLALGVRDSFLKHMADDAIVFRPGPVNAKALYEGRPSSKAVRLEWWPQKVVIARSGDLGLSVGPAAVNGQRGGYYATIWRKAADGQWKWIYDGGAEADGAKAPGQDTPAIHGPIARTGAKSPAAGFDAARLAETALAKAAENNAPNAYRTALPADAWLLGPEGTAGLTPDALAERIDARPERMILTLRGGGASAAGDLVWTHGEAGWVDHQEIIRHAHYMHVWQRRAEGWRLIFETLNTDT
jgi:ketosteroid isomerase-like protein